MRKLLSLVAALLLSVSVSAGIKPLSGFDKKVYDGSLALYASSKLEGRTDKFICTAQVVAKVKGGYELLSAGHCTPSNQNGELPPDLTYKVADELGGPLYPVTLVAAYNKEPVDWALYYFKTDREYPVIELGDENDIALNSPTIDVNFSLGIAKEVSLGVVSSYVQTQGPMKGFYEVTEFDSHGASGSAVVSEKTKKIIGVVIAGVDGTVTPTWVEPASVIQGQIAGIDVTTARYVPPLDVVKFPSPADEPESDPLVDSVLGYNVGLCAPDGFAAFHISVTEDELVVTEILKDAGPVKVLKSPVVFKRVMLASRDKVRMYANRERDAAIFVTLDKGQLIGKFVTLGDSEEAPLYGWQGAENGLQQDAMALRRSCNVVPH